MKYPASLGEPDYQGAGKVLGVLAQVESVSFGENDFSSAGVLVPSERVSWDAVCEMAPDVLEGLTSLSMGCEVSDTTIDGHKGIRVAGRMEEDGAELRIEFLFVEENGSLMGAAECMCLMGVSGEELSVEEFEAMMQSVSVSS